MIVIPADITVTSFISSGPQEHIFKSEVTLTGLNLDLCKEAQSIR